MDRSLQASRSSVTVACAPVGSVLADLERQSREKAGARNGSSFPPFQLSRPARNLSPHSATTEPPATLARVTAVPKLQFEVYNLLLEISVYTEA